MVRIITPNECKVQSSKCKVTLRLLCTLHFALCTFLIQNGLKLVNAALPIQCFGKGAGGQTHAAGFGAVGAHLADGVRERGGVIWRHKQPGDAMLHNFFGRARAGGDDWHTARVCLGNNKTKARAGAGGQHKHIRRAQQPGQRSTLEAACTALGLLEGRPAHYAPLLDAFSGWVAQVAARAAAGSRPR